MAPGDASACDVEATAMMRQRGAGSMASVFVSHSSRDRAATARVVERLRAAGFAALFVDFDPEQGIPAGRSWVNRPGESGDSSP